MKSASLGLGPDEFEALRRHALRAGRMVERDGLSVFGFGEALRLPLPAGLTDPAALLGITSALRRLGDGAVAIGTFHFLPDSGVELVVPEICVRVAGGAEPRVIITLDENADPSAVLEGALAVATARGAGTDDAEGGDADAEAPPDSFTLASSRPHADFMQRVEAAVEEIRSGRLEKVVMAREVVITANRPLRQGDLLERLRSLHPSCLAFAVEGFLGASPELLVRRTGTDFESHPLAGTAPRSGDPEADRRIEQALLCSEKDRAEHGAVVDAITAGLAPVMAELDAPESPSIVELRNVSHLGTRITGRVGAVPDPDGPGEHLPSALELLARIHPTPAVCGTPSEAALEYLAKVEELDRDRYAGAVGWVDSAGDGEWHLGIRCAIVDGRQARLFAGVGIVADSGAAAELRETQLKLQAFLAAAVRP